MASFFYEEFTHGVEYSSGLRMCVGIDHTDERMTSRSGMRSSGPKARPIPAWGNAPGMRRDVVFVRAEGPTYPVR